MEHNAILHQKRTMNINQPVAQIQMAVFKISCNIKKQLSSLHKYFPQSDIRSHCRGYEKRHKYQIPIFNIMLRPHLNFSASIARGPASDNNKKTQSLMESFADS